MRIYIGMKERFVIYKAGYCAASVKKNNISLLLVKNLVFELCLSFSNHFNSK